MTTVGIDDLEKLSSLRASEHAQQELINTQTEAVVTFTGGGGWASGVVMSYLPYAGSFWVTAVADRSHARAVRRDPRVSVVISNAGTGLSGRRMMTVRCLAHTHTNESTKKWFYRAFAEYLNVASPQGFVDLLDSGNRVVMELRPVRISTSHDSRNLPGDGRGGQRPDSWEA